MPVDIDISKVILKKEGIEFLERGEETSGILRREEPFSSHLSSIEITPKRLLNDTCLFDFFKRELESKTIKNYIHGLITSGNKEDIFVIRRRLKEEGVIESKRDGGSILTHLLLHQISDHEDISPQKRCMKILNIQKIEKLKAKLDKENKRLEDEKLSLQEKLKDLQNRIEKISLSLEGRYKNHEIIDREFNINLSEYQSLKKTYEQEMQGIDARLNKLDKVLSVGSESIRSYQTMYSQGKKIYVDSNFRRVDQRIVESKQEKYERLQKLYNETKNEKKKWQERLESKKNKLKDIRSKFLTSEKMIKYFEHVNENCKRTEERLREQIKSLEEKREAKLGELEITGQIIDSYESCKKFLEESINELSLDIDSIGERVRTLVNAVKGLDNLRETEETYKENLRRINERIKELRSSFDKNYQLIKEIVKKSEESKESPEEDMERVSLGEDFSALDFAQEKVLEEISREVEERKRLIRERKEYFEGIKGDLERGSDEIEDIEGELTNARFRLSTNSSILTVSSIEREAFFDLFLFLVLKLDSQNSTLKKIKEQVRDCSGLLRELRPRESLDLKNINPTYYRKKYSDLTKECEYKKEAFIKEEEEEKEVAIRDEEVPSKVEERIEEEPKQENEGLHREMGRLRDELSRLSLQNRYFLEELNNIKSITASYPVKKEESPGLQGGIVLLTQSLNELTREDIVALLKGNSGDETRKRIEGIYGCITRLLEGLFEGKGFGEDLSGLKEIIEAKVSDFRELFSSLEEKDQVVAKARDENAKVRMRLDDLAGELADSLIQNKHLEERFLQEIEKKDQKIGALNDKIEKLSLQLLQYEESQSRDSGEEKKDNVILFDAKREEEEEETPSRQYKIQSSSVKKAISTLILFSGVIYHLINQSSHSKILSQKSSDYFMTSTIQQQVEMITETQQEKREVLSELLEEDSPKAYFSLTENIKDEIYLPALKRSVRVRDFLTRHDKVDDKEFLTGVVLKRVQDMAHDYDLTPAQFISFMNSAKESSLPLTVDLLKRTREDIAFLDKEYKGFIKDLEKEIDIADSLHLVYRLNELIQLDEKGFFLRMYNEFVDLGFSRKTALLNILHNERMLKERSRTLKDNYMIVYKGTIRPIKILEEIGLKEFKEIAVPYIKNKYREFAHYKGLRVPQGLDEYAVNMAENIYISAKRFNIPVTSLMTITHQESFFINILGDNKKSASPFQIYRPTKLKILEQMRRDGFRISRDVKHLQNHLSLAGYMAAYHFADLVDLYAKEYELKDSGESIKKIIYDLNKSTTSYNGGKRYHKEVFLKQLELQRFVEKRLQSKGLLS